MNTNAIWESCIQKARTMSGHYSLSEEEQRFMFDLAMTLPAGSTIVEIGVCNGRTAAVLNYVAKERHLRYYGVDNFSLENTADNVRSSLQALGYYPDFLVGDSAKVPWHGGPIGLLLIDGGHDEASVHKDCEKWIPMVASGGIVAWHDYDIEYDPKSAHHAIREHADRITQDWEIIPMPEGVFSLFAARKP